MSQIEEIENDLTELSIISPNTLRLFLTGANPFVLSIEKLKTIARLSKQYFPKLTNIGCYARITDITSKSIEELKELRAIGYNRLTIDVETSDDAALSFRNKGYTSNDILVQCKKIRKANIDYNVFYLTEIYDNANKLIMQPISLYNLQTINI